MWRYGLASGAPREAEALATSYKRQAESSGPEEAGRVWNWVTGSLGVEKGVLRPQQAQRCRPSATDLNPFM